MNVTASSIGPSLAKVAIVCLLSLPLAGAAGCASAPDAPAAIGLVELGPVAMNAVPGGELRAAAGGRATFADVSESPDALKLAIEHAPSAGGEAAAYVQRRLLIGNGGEKLIRAQSLALREDGAVVLTEEINHAEGVEVVFTPPMVVIPASVAPGEFPEFVGHMTVHPLGDRSRIRAKGPVKVVATCEGAFRVRTPAGEFEAWKLSSTLNAELGPSRVQNETVIWLVHGIGLIAEERRERTTVMGVPIRGNTEKWVIVEAPAAAEIGHGGAPGRTEGESGEWPWMNADQKKERRPRMARMDTDEDRFGGEPRIKADERGSEEEQEQRLPQMNPDLPRWKTLRWG